MAHAALELIRVTKRYGTTTAVDAIDLKITGGTYCCLLGPSGCGKTSTLRMIAGHEAVSEGDIIIGPECHGSAAGAPGHCDDVSKLCSIPPPQLRGQCRVLSENAGGRKEDQARPRP